MRRRYRIMTWTSGSVIALLILLLVIVHFFLAGWVKDYVNKQIAAIPGYEGEVQDITLHLYRGAYAIHGLSIRKVNGHIPVPFIAIDTMDLSVEWRALLNGSIVAEIVMDRPVLNFAVNAQGTKAQTGKGVDWTDRVKKLLPININRVAIQEGKLSYRDFSTSPEVNLHIDHMNGEVRNLQNVTAKDQALPSSMHLTGESIGRGQLKVDGRMNALANPIALQMELGLEKVDLTALNNYFEAFAFVDVKKGTFNLYSKLTVDKGMVDGYVKPMASHIELIDLNKSNNPLQVAWEAVVSAVITIFTNQRHDQFATVIPVSGKLGSVETDNWAALVGVIRNAFIEALRKGITE